MLDIRNHVDEALNQRTRKLSAIKSLVVHRITDRSGHFRHPEDLITAFKDTRKYAAGSYTGGQVPYHFFINRHGVIHQLLPLNKVGPGARGINLQSIHIAVSGDFRKTKPTFTQVKALKALVCKLTLALGPKEVRGHTERGFSGKLRVALGKECPGKNLDMDNIRLAVKVNTALLRAEHSKGILLNG